MTINERAKKIKLFLMDVDGVLTDGKMYFFENSKEKILETKSFNALDGIGLSLLSKYKINTGIITGRESKFAELRAKAMNMSYAYQGFLSKLKPLEEIIKIENISYENVAYIGDDLTDLSILKKVGLSCAPNNAVKEIKKSVHFICERNGGDGAVREVCDLILESKGYMDEIIKDFENAIWHKKEKKPIKVVLFSKQ